MPRLPNDDQYGLEDLHEYLVEDIGREESALAHRVQHTLDMLDACHDPSELNFSVLVGTLDVCKPCWIRLHNIFGRAPHLNFGLVHPPYEETDLCCCIPGCGNPLGVDDNDSGGYVCDCCEGERDER